MNKLIAFCSPLFFITLMIGTLVRDHKVSSEFAALTFIGLLINYWLSEIRNKQNEK